MRTAQRWVLLATAVATATVGLSACRSSGTGDSSSTSGATNAVGGAHSGAATGSPILIGELTPTSGQGFNYPDWVAGARAAARAINAAGGIKGRPIQIAECDDRNDPNGATTCARQMVSKKVIAVAGGATFFGNTMVPILNQANIPWVGDFPETDPEYKSPNMFLIDSGNIQAGGGTVAALKAAGVKKIFGAHLGVAQGDAVFSVAKAAAKAAGVPLVGDASFPLTATDMTQYVQSAIDSGADGVTFGGTQQQQFNFIKTAGQLGAKFTIGVVDGSMTVAQYRSIGNKVKVVVNGSVPPVTAANTYPSKYPGVAQFTKDMAAEFASGNKYADPKVTSLHALVAWLSVKAIAQVAATAPTLDGKSVLAALNAAKNITTGVIPPWTPSAQGPKNYPRISSPYLWISRIASDGQAQLLNAEPVGLSVIGLGS